jgi:hypothetical protein
LPFELGFVPVDEAERPRGVRAGALALYEYTIAEQIDIKSGTDGCQAVSASLEPRFMYKTSATHKLTHTAPAAAPAAAREEAHIHQTTKHQLHNSGLSPVEAKDRNVKASPQLEGNMLRAAAWLDDG